MKILHTSDWHLGKRLEDYSRIGEQRALLDEIDRIASLHKANVIVVAGDLFDTFNPPGEAVDLFYQALKKMSKNGQRPIIAIAGNHDSPDRIEAPDPLARECGIVFAGHPNILIEPFELDSGLKVLQSERGFIELKLPASEDPLRILITPYANEFRLKSYLGKENSDEALRQLLQERWQQLADKYCDNKGVNLLLSHLFMIKKGSSPPDEPDDEKPILHVGGAQAIYSENVPAQIQYTAMGHLHRMHAIDESDDKAMYYSGSPLSYSFAEAMQKKYVLLADVEPGKTARVEKIELTSGKPLLRKKAYSMDEAINWLTENQDALVELTMVSDNFLSAQERRRLQQAHSGIISIVPEVLNAEVLLNQKNQQIDLSQSMEALFTSYVKHTRGQAPDKAMMDLFKEMLSEE
ncbi:metallophosphoesterase family protein [Roseimarinus sediminis]|uniref:metallophosphoesterase family protein n=1 Tax=Roseimarinus sediminis TaxID=1610899 RepID=UPI003D212CD9